MIHLETLWKTANTNIISLESVSFFISLVNVELKFHMEYVKSFHRCKKYRRLKLQEDSGLSPIRDS